MKKKNFNSDDDDFTNKNTQLFYAWENGSVVSCKKKKRTIKNFKWPTHLALLFFQVEFLQLESRLRIESID